MRTLTYLLEDWNPNHTVFQMDSFITGQEGITMWGCYRQAMRELAGRIGAVREQAADLANDQIDFDALTKKGKMRWKDHTQKEQERFWEDPKDKVEHWRLGNQLHMKVMKFRTRLAEFQQFYAQVVALKPKFKDADHRELEMEFWATKFRLDCGLRILAGQALGPDIWRHAMMLPEAQREPLMRALNEPNALTTFAKEWRPPVIAVTALPEPHEILELLDVPHSTRRALGITATTNTSARTPVEGAAGAGISR